MPKAEPPRRAGRAAQPIHWVRRQHKGQPKPAPFTSRINPRELDPHGRSRRVCSAARAVHQSRNRPASPTCSPGLAIGTAQETAGVSHTAPVIDTTSSDSRSTRLKSTSCPATGRRWPNFALLAPGVTFDQQRYGRLSFCGISILASSLSRTATTTGAQSTPTHRHHWLHRPFRQLASQRRPPYLLERS
jgi:hypothetical protein